MAALDQLRELWRSQPSSASHVGAVFVLLNTLFVIALVVVGVNRFPTLGAAAVVFAAPVLCTLALLAGTIHLIRLKVDEQHWRRANEVNRQLTAAIAFLILYSAVDALQGNAFATAASAFVVVGVVFQAVGPGYTAYREAISAVAEADREGAKKKRQAVNGTANIHFELSLPCRQRHVPIAGS